jgi:hypothetical protein
MELLGIITGVTGDESSMTKRNNAMDHDKEIQYSFQKYYYLALSFADLLFWLGLPFWMNILKSVQPFGADCPGNSVCLATDPILFDSSRKTPG